MLLALFALRDKQDQFARKGQNAILIVYPQLPSMDSQVNPLLRARQITRTTRQSCTIMPPHHRCFHRAHRAFPRAVSKAKVGTITSRP